MQPLPKPIGVKPIELLREIRTVRSVIRLARPSLPSLRRLRVAHGEPVLTLPGFGFGDSAMASVRSHLRRAGFKPYKWSLGVNRGDVPETIPKVVERIVELSDSLGEPLRLVGWSLGGFIAREAAREVPDRVAHIVTLGSPIRGGPKYTAAASIYRRRGVDLDAIEAQVAERTLEPLPVPVTCIYSRQDGVVDWRAAIDSQNPLAANIEVDCSHLAMGLDPNVMKIMLRELEHSLSG